MKNNFSSILLAICSFLFLTLNNMTFADFKTYQQAIDDPAAARLARPLPQQYTWHEQERILFLCISTNTWQNREYDDHSTPLEKMKLEKLDTDQWCRAATSMGAKEVLFVAKHTGGFCLWQTETTDYSLKSIPWKNGKGDMLKELSENCKKFNLNLGVYIYPGDDQWGAGIGSGGITKDPKKQEGYNKVLRQQWREVLTRYGKVNECWFDGSCKVPLKDILLEHAPDAVFFQGPLASVRWPGTESAILPYPAWNSLSKKDLDSGVATAKHGNPDGDAWAPLEADTVLYGNGGHKWFWSEQNEKLRHTLDQLMLKYYKSVGHGGVLLLNATPNTDGLIPEGDMKRYQEFGDEIKRRFDHPLKETEGFGKEYIIKFEKPTIINQAQIMEDYRYGERIRKYVLEGKLENGLWSSLNIGSAIGRKRIVVFKPQSVTQVRLKIVENVGEPLLRSLKIYHVKNMDTSQLVDKLPAISQGKPAKASSVHSPPYTANKINDGNMKTRWGATDNSSDWWIEIDLQQQVSVNKVKLFELENRVRKFRLQYKNDKDQAWQTCLSDGNIGDDYEKEFDPVSGRYFRLKIDKATFAPTIWEFQLFYENPSHICHRIEPSQFKDGKAELLLNLTKYFTKPGQYIIEINTENNSLLEVLHFEPLYNNQKIQADLYSTVEKNRVYNINRTAQIIEESKISLKLTLKGKNQKGTIRIIAPDY